MKKISFLISTKIYKILPNQLLKKMPRLDYLFGIIYKKTNPNEVLLINVMNRKMYVNTTDIGVAEPLIKAGIYEEFETEVFKKLLTSNTTFIDIGANIGYYTLLSSDIIKKGYIYSFEPVITNYELLVKNVNLNDLKNVKIFQKAISYKNGKVKIFIDEKNLGNHSLAENNIVDKSKSEFFEVETITLDSFIKTFKEYIDGNIVIKIDTQGAEGLVLEGAQNLLVMNDLKILMEFWPNGLKNMGTDPLELLNKLEKYGFKFKLLDEKSRSLKNLDKIEIINICDDGDEDQVNLLLERN